MITPAGLAEIKSYADGVGPWKRQFVGVRAVALSADGKPLDVNGNGRASEADGVSMKNSNLIADAKAAGLFIHPYTMRSDVPFARDYAGGSNGQPSVRDVAAAWPHWRELRHSMASLSAQTSPHWREAMPVIAIAGLAFVALLLLQFSHDVRIVPGFAQREELADERLAALANAEVTLMMPQLAELQLPTLPAGSTAPISSRTPGGSFILMTMPRTIVASLRSSRGRATTPRPRSPTTRSAASKTALERPRTSIKG